MRRLTLVMIAFALLGGSLARSVESNLAELEQQALRSAADAVADSVVQIRTVGGLDRIGKTLLSHGPTTGLIVSEDGYIVSSAFNFAGQPTSILVRLASGKQLAAELVARDKSRMLVLLKVETDLALSVPEPAAMQQLRVGQWAVALGRTFQAEEVGLSVGIVSALNRMYGRVIQTDANVSVANYGGPLVNVAGRVIGVLVPMAPSAMSGGTEAELAGANFYDSGIGFAVPFEHVLAMLQRWKEGEDLLPGKLGVGLTNGNAHLLPPEITSVWPNSPAADAGWKPKDRIVAVEGVEVATQSQLRFQIVPRYAGDTVNVRLRRGEETLETKVTLAGELAPYQHAFLGILPSRQVKTDDSEGMAIRGIWPDSPAAEAGIEAGDHVLKIEETNVESNDDVRKAMQALHPKEEAAVTVVRDGKELVLTATLATLPEEILTQADLPKTSDAPGKVDDEASVLQSLQLPEFSRHAKYLKLEFADKGSVGMLLWLTKGDDDVLAAQAAAWQVSNQRGRVVLVLARPQDKDAGWGAEDLAYLDRLSRTVQKKWRVDGRRIVVSGQGKAGQVALALAIKRRGFFSGVVSIDAPLPRTLKLPDNSPASRLAILMVETRNSNFAPLLRRDLKQLREASYPASWLQRPPTNDGLLDTETRDNIARWMDGLDCY